MRLFRRTEFDGLVAVTPQDLTSSGAHLLSWKEDALRRRQDNESTNDFPTVPTSLVSTPAVSVASTVPDLPNNAPSSPALASSSGPLGLGLGLIPTAAAASATSSPAPSATPSASQTGGDGLLGLGVGASLGVGGLLGGDSTPAAEATTSVAPAPTSVTPETPTVVPTSAAPVAPVQPAPDAAPSSLPAATNAPAETPTTTPQGPPQGPPQGAPQGAPTSVALPTQPTTSIPVAQSSSAIVPVQQSSSAAAIVPAKSSSLAKSFSPASTSVQSSGEVSSVSTALEASSTLSTSASVSDQKATLTSSGIFSITPSAAADLNNPTLATSMITSVTKTGSIPGVTTETTGSGIIVTETLKPSNGMSSGTMIGVVVGSAAGGLIIAALILFLVRKFIRMRRIAKAESPPPSPLLNALNPPLSPLPPLRIEVGMHERMTSNDSDFWVSGKGSSINEKEIGGHGYPMPISPLPSLPENGQEIDAGTGQPNFGRANGGFKFFPKVDRNGEGKEVMPRDF